MTGKRINTIARAWPEVCGKEGSMNRKVLFNTGWRFAKTALGVSYEQKEVWQVNLKPVALPHDWLIWQTDKLYEDGIGWYVREWQVGKKAGERIHLRFDGVYMDSALYVNDQLVGSGSTDIPLLNTM